jgi:7-cyano-7-deazaguanine synthase
MKSIVLLSAGMDSTVNLYLAKEHTEVALALTFDYGQRAAKKELSRAEEICRQLKIKHQIVKLNFFSEFGKSSLIDHSKEVPTNTEVKIDDMAVSLRTAKSVWVPNRNGIFLNIAAGYAEALDAQIIIPGFNIEEASTFPDNSKDFMDELSRSLSYSTANRVRVECYTVEKNKIEIVQMGERSGVDWSLIWPCYFDLDKACGQCESCQRAKRAFSKNGVNYANFMD